MAKPQGPLKAQVDPGVTGPECSVGPAVEPRSLPCCLPISPRGMKGSPLFLLLPTLLDCSLSPPPSPLGRVSTPASIHPSSTLSVSVKPVTTSAGEATLPSAGLLQPSLPLTHSFPTLSCTAPAFSTSILRKFSLTQW